MCERLITALLARGVSLLGTLLAFHTQLHWNVYVCGIVLGMPFARLEAHICPAQEPPDVWQPRAPR